VGQGTRISGLIETPPASALARHITLLGMLVRLAAMKSTGRVTVQESA
jgi:hypothetical protein